MAWETIPYRELVGATSDDLGTQSNWGFYYTLWMELSSEECGDGRLDDRISVVVGPTCQHFAFGEGGNNGGGDKDERCMAKRDEV